MKSRAAFFVLTILFGLALGGHARADDPPDPVDLPYFNPYTNNPPGPPPNYDVVDSTYFQGVPDLPEPLENNAGGYYIFNDTAEGKWYITNFLYSRGYSLEQFHGSILATLEQDPAPGVNIWPNGFELSDNLHQNDRWGWVKWPDEIAPNLYEIWWDITIDYAKVQDIGDYRDTIGVCIAGCAIDFNIWASGHGDPFGIEQIYLGKDMTPLSEVPGFADWYVGIYDQYQINNPEEDPNTSIFTPKALPGATYNAEGLVTVTKCGEYGERYEGSWAYEANGVQFATLFCPPNLEPNFIDPPSTVETITLCPGESIVRTIEATDPDPTDLLTITQIAGPGSLTSTPSVSPVTGTFELYPSYSGEYNVSFEVSDGVGGVDYLDLTFHVTLSTAPTVTLPNDTTIALCGTTEICLPVEIEDDDCDVTSVTTTYGSYTGTMADFDQIDRILALGGTVTQIGGGDPGKVLLTASDFVPPINSLSGVDVTLPNFVFSDAVVDYGTFPNGLEQGNAADYMLGAPTDMTFTTPGPGGPDGGDGDGSVAFSTGYNCILGFSGGVTTCHGANADFVIFTNTNGGGTATLEFMLDGTSVHSLSRVVPGGAAASGIGGVTFDLPDGITFNEVSIVCDVGPIEIDAIAVRTDPSSTTNDVCFVADSPGVYELEVTAEDACGNTGYDIVLVTIEMNSPPIANAGSDFSVHQCESSEICWGVAFSDPDDNIVLTELVSGPGTLSGDQICFTPSMAGVYTFVIRAVDECGAEGFDTVVVTVTTNGRPIAVDPSPVTQFQCEPTELCHTFTAADPNGDPLTWSLVSGPGSVTGAGEYCFTPTATGVYVAKVAVSDPCLAADTAVITYTITLNSAPVAVDPPSPVERFLCDPEEICYQFSAGDVDGGTLTWSQLSGAGTVTADGLWCFTPSATGSYTVEAAVTDECGASDTVTKTFEVTLNDAPTIAFGADISRDLCAPEEICVEYTVDDPQGADGLIETMISGFGTLNTETNQVCFTPTADGCYEIIVAVTDDCGEIDKDTINVCVSFGAVAEIACPTEPIEISLCEPDDVCQILGITPVSATVGVSYGTYSAGELCFYADTSGRYEIEVTADEACGSDLCELVFLVTVGQAAQITCPEPQTIFLCEADDICVPVGINGSGVNVTVSPIGSYQAGNVCFPADTSGHYEIEVLAATSCGSDACTIVADITINSAPIATDPTTPVDTFICEADQVCYQFNATDVDGGSLTWSRLSGSGTVGSGGQWCFDASVSGTYSVTAVVTDECGAADTTTLTYNVTVNAKPLFVFDTDQTTVFLCESQTVCVPYSIGDADDNLTDITIISGAGVIDDNNDRLCFLPLLEDTYRFIVRVTDECLAETLDTVDVTIEFNEEPVVFAGDDLDVFQCTPTQICWPVSASDPDDNLASVQLISGPGAYTGTTICFTPTTSWCYEFILKATDDCGEESFDTVAVCVTLNSAPVADAGEDQTLSLCTPTEVCLPVSATDVDDNLTGLALVEGPGSFDGSNICFTPEASGDYTFIIEATDDCGLTHRDTVVVHVTLNSAPICTVPDNTTIFQCAATEVCLPAFATDVDGNLSHCQVDVGTLSGGNWCYTPTAEQVVTVTMTCEDACGAVCESQFTVEFVVNHDPEIAFGPDQTIFLCNLTEVCLPFTASDPDFPRPVTITLVSGPGTLDLENNQVCFTPPDAGVYTFIIEIEDECGAIYRDTIVVTIETNTAPVAQAGDDQTLSLCEPTELCWPASCSDADGNLLDCIFTGPGSYTGSSICFTPTVSGSYQFSLRAVDDCGLEMTDVVTIDVTVNSPPTVAFGEDFSQFLCEPQEICLQYTVDDPDGLTGLTEELLPGPGTINTTANTVCFTPTADGVYEFVVRVTDDCGEEAYDTIRVTITFGEAAEIACPVGAFDLFMCDADSVIQPLAITPPGATVVVSEGIYDDGALRFLAATGGTYNIRVIASEACGADTCDLTFNIDFNSPPVASAGDDFAVEQCAAEEICWDAACSDVDGNLTACELFSGPGTYSGGRICFTPTGSGVYEFVLKATDACGETDYDEITVEVTINSPPTLAVQDDPDLFLCDPEEVCVSYMPSDPDGLTGLVETMISGYGTLDAEADEVCFTPTAAGDYPITIRVTDPCGEYDEQTITVHVEFGESAAIECPPEPIAVSLCSPETVCYLLDVMPATAVVTTTLGTYQNGELCFYADTTGTYVDTVIASETCGADTCVITFLVDIGSAAQITCPDPQNLFICEAETVCLPVTIMGPGVSVTVSPIGSYSGGNVCFPADTSGHYEIDVEATTSCGSASCTIVADITINSAPIAVDPVTPVDTFICAADQIQFQFEASDVDGGTLTWTRLSGAGSVTTDGLWSFDATEKCGYCVEVEVADQCGAADTTTLCYTVGINDKPVVTFGPDVTLDLCTSESYCFNYSVTDADNNVVLEELLSGPAGSFDTSADEICFTPSTSGTYPFIVGATDACGASGSDTISITVNIGSDVTVTCPDPTTLFLCEPTTVCRPVDISTTAATVTVDPIGTYADGEVCFTADTAGHYVIDVSAVSACGSDACQFVVDVVLNANPIAEDPATPVDTFICAADRICYQFAASDVDGGALEWTKLSGDGAVNASGEWCFDASTGGSYTVSAAVTDECDAADTVTLTYNLTINSEPTVALGADDVEALCEPQELCYPFTLTDADDNITDIALISGDGVLDTEQNQVCFTPNESGTYRFIVGVTDACDAYGADTLDISVELNTPPVAAAGGDQVLFLAGPTEICWPASCGDADANLSDCALISPAGDYDGSEICFTPDTAGTYLFIMRAEDACGEHDQDTAIISITYNQPPVCDLPPNQTFFQCTAEEVSLSVGATDPDDNFDHCELLSGPGSLVGGNWTYTPTTDESVVVTVVCIDEMGASCEGSFTIDFEINGAPVVDAGNNFTELLCSPVQICWDVSVDDPDGNVTTIELTSEWGSFNESAMEICFTPPDGERTYPFILKATDDCGEESADTIYVSIEYNSAPELFVLPDFVAYLDGPGEVCFGIDVFDEDDNLAGVTVSSPATWNAATSEVCFYADTAGCYCFAIEAYDECPDKASTLKNVCVTVVIDECLHVQIEKAHGTIQGQVETVSLFLNGTGKPLGGFDMLIGYDQSALTVVAVNPGNLFESCGWEYFNYRFGVEGNCSGCPSGLLRVMGIAETNNGAYHPGCFFEGMYGALADVSFLISNDRTLQCQYVPIRFFWTDCGYNSFSGQVGDTLWISREVYTFEGNSMADNLWGFPGYYGAPDNCIMDVGPDKPAAQRCVDFTNGGVDIICADSIDGRGDINLNEVAYEIADAVLFTNYFVYGLGVFTVNLQGQIAATDVNADGLALSVADLVYLIRVVVGDALATAKPVPGTMAEAELTVINNVLTIAQADAPVGAISLVLEGEADPELHPAAEGMELRYAFDGANTRVLIYNLDGESYVQTGEVLKINGSHAIKEIDIGGYDGFVMGARLNMLPDCFSLSQNYPNPFNPITLIEFGLPVASEWELVIYNVLGQVVHTFSDNSEAGYIKVEWDASQYASGVYFYRLVAGEFSSTKKMVLLK